MQSFFGWNKKTLVVKPGALWRKKWNFNVSMLIAFIQESQPLF